MNVYMYQHRILLHQIGLFPYKALLHKNAHRVLSQFSGRVLDVGAGKQPFKNYFNSNVEYITMDSNNANSPDIVGDIQNINLPMESFDGIICTEVLEHVPEPLGALCCLSNILKRGGYLYLTVPMCWGLHYEPHDYFRFTKYGLQYLLQKTNFKILEIKQLGGVFSVAFARLLDVSSTIIFRATWPLKYILGDALRIKLVSACMLPFVFFLSYFFRFLDLIIPRAKEDALGWAVFGVKESDGIPCELQ